MWSRLSGPSVSRRYSLSSLGIHGEGSRRETLKSPQRRNVTWRGGLLNLLTLEKKDSARVDVWYLENWAMLRILGSRRRRSSSRRRECRTLMRRVWLLYLSKPSTLPVSSASWGNDYRRTTILGSGLVFGISGVPCGLIEQRGDQHISQGRLSMRYWPMTIAST